MAAREKIIETLLRNQAEIDVLRSGRMNGGCLRHLLFSLLSLNFCYAAAFHGQRAQACRLLYDCAALYSCAGHGGPLPRKDRGSVRGYYHCRHLSPVFPSRRKTFAGSDHCGSRTLASARVGVFWHLCALSSFGIA